ncbi:MAG: undecaprenyl-diphosphate phosphatase [Lentimonas sp.]
MRILFSTLLICCIAGLNCLQASDEPSNAITRSTDGSDNNPETSLSYGDAVVLGLIEGLTEYLPVSSTGHLILANAFLGLDGDTPMHDSDGNAILVKEDGVERPYTIGESAYAYVIVIQAGAIVAVVYLYWKTILSILLGCLGRDPNGRKLAINLIAAFIPAAVIGLLLDDWIEAQLGDNITAVAAALIVGAIVMLVVERWRKSRDQADVNPSLERELHELPIKQAVMIGFFQCFAMWPGTSRSMATIVGGYIAGLSPARAAEFSFLLGLITLSAASGYKFVSDGGNMLSALQVGPVLVGCFVAFVSAALAVKWLVGYLSRHGLAIFAWYRIILAIAVFYFIA